MVTVDVMTLGKYVMVTNDEVFRDVFVCRVKPLHGAPPGAVNMKDGTYIVGFSRKCSHMSCRLVADNSVVKVADELPTNDGLLSCRCHSSCFDLTNFGLPVIGPATDGIASVELKAVDDPVTQVEVIGWQRIRSMPYGVPYGGTSENPPESEDAHAG